MFRILTEKPEDSGPIETLLNQVFGPDRQGKTSYTYRHNIAAIADLCLVARDRDKVVGSLRFWPVNVGHTGALLLGPIGVSPDRQKTGIGRALMARGHFLARSKGYGIVLLVGNGDYYCRFGYMPAGDYGISMANEQPHRLLVHELRSGVLRGVSGEVLIKPA